MFATTFIQKYNYQLSNLAINKLGGLERKYDSIINVELSNKAPKALTFFPKRRINLRVVLRRLYLTSLLLMFRSAPIVS